MAGPLAPTGAPSSLVNYSETTTVIVTRKTHAVGMVFFLGLAISAPTVAILLFQQGIVTKVGDLILIGAGGGLSSAEALLFLFLTSKTEKRIRLTPERKEKLSGSRPPLPPERRERAGSISKKDLEVLRRPTVDEMHAVPGTKEFFAEQRVRSLVEWAEREGAREGNNMAAQVLPLLDGDEEVEDYLDQHEGEPGYPLCDRIEKLKACYEALRNERETNCGLAGGTAYMPYRTAEGLVESLRIANRARVFGWMGDNANPPAQSFWEEAERVCRSQIERFERFLADLRQWEEEGCSQPGFHSRIREINLGEARTLVNALERLRAYLLPATQLMVARSRREGAQEAEIEILRRTIDRLENQLSESGNSINPYEILPDYITTARSLREPLPEFTARLVEVISKRDCIMIFEVDGTLREVGERNPTRPPYVLLHRLDRFYDVFIPPAEGWNGQDPRLASAPSPLPDAPSSTGSSGPTAGALSGARALPPPPGGASSSTMTLPDFTPLGASAAELARAAAVQRDVSRDLTLLLNGASSSTARPVEMRPLGASAQERAAVTASLFGPPRGHPAARASSATPPPHTPENVLAWANGELARGKGMAPLISQLVSLDRKTMMRAHMNQEDPTCRSILALTERASNPPRPLVGGTLYPSKSEALGFADLIPQTKEGDVGEQVSTAMVNRPLNEQLQFWQEAERACQEHLQELGGLRNRLPQWEGCEEQTQQVSKSMRLLDTCCIPAVRLMLARIQHQSKEIERQEAACLTANPELQREDLRPENLLSMYIMARQCFDLPAPHLDELFFTAFTEVTKYSIQIFKPDGSIRTINGSSDSSIVLLERPDGFYDYFAPSPGWNRRDPRPPVTS